ncbi:MAG: cytochrome c oxidase accessory protein CcoG [Sinimarinibacterium sp.]|jgi:cytochrome c oxidase accessory protein FixG
MTPQKENTVSFYQSAAKIYPREVHGRYARLRVLSMFALLGFYYAVPWISWNDVPLVLFDLPARRFHVFGLTLVPQDFYLLTAMLAMAAFTLFFFTTLAGRIWCGFACPQTVWTEAFMWIERYTEGDRYARIKLDRAPWNVEKVLRKGSKHLLWGVFALYTGLTFVAFFVPAHELFPAALKFELQGWAAFWALFYGFATWGNAGFLREQVCKYMCPYARFQSAMFDKDTLIVAYDARRGEPRKSLARKLAREAGPAAALAGELDTPSPAAKQAGDCIDCSMCVQVCPVGIDIRKGLQYECITCGACVDACNDVMDSVKKPHGLIRFTSDNHDFTGKFHIFRPRAIGYGVVWVLVVIGFGALVLMRSPLSFDVIRDRKQLYRELVDGGVENVYAVKLSNKTDQPHRYQLSAAFVGDDAEVTLDPTEVEVGAGVHASVTVAARSEDPPRGVSKIEFSVRGIDVPKHANDHQATFLAPADLPEHDHQEDSRED